MPNTLPTVPNAAEMLAVSAWHGIIGMVITDKDGIIRAANEKMCNLLDYSERELVGKHFREITAPADQSIDETEFSLLMDGKIDHYALAKTWVSKRHCMIAGNLFVQRMDTGEITFAVSQVVESQSPEQIAAMAVMVRGFMDEMLEKQGLRIVTAAAADEHEKAWYRNWEAWAVLVGAWPIIVSVIWVIYKIARVIEGNP